MTGLTLSAPDLATEWGLDRLLELMQAVQRHDEFPDAWTRTEVEELLAKPFFDPTADLVVAHDGADPVGWAHVWHRPSGEIRERVLVYGGVHAEARGRGVGRELLRWAEDRARQRLQDCDPSIEHWLLVDALESLADRQRLHRRLGFEPVRWFVEMKRPLDDELPAPILPPGIEIVPWTDEHTVAVRDVNAEAFADHWGSTPYSEADWADIIAEEQTRLDLSFVALDGGEIVGYSLNDVFPDNDPAGERVAWIGSIGTRRAYRRRGIAGSLLQHSHHRFAEAGFTHAQLDVDADSPSGAGAIYERHGYRALRRIVVSMKVLNR